MCAAVSLRRRARHAPAAVHGVKIHGASMKRLAAPEQPPRAAEARARPTERSLTEQSLRCDDERQQANDGESQDEMEGESIPKEKRLEKLSRNSLISRGSTTSYTGETLVESW